MKHLFIQQLKQLQSELFDVMESWPSDSSFDAAKIHAEAIAPLIAGQIQKLGKTVCLNQNDSMKLRSELEKLRDLMAIDEEKKRFSEHIAMMDSLIEAGH